MDAITIPDIRYARVDGLRIGYQEFGVEDGPRTLIIPPLISNIDVLWDNEIYRRMFDHMGRFMRIVHFDKRGIGLSDRFEDVPTIDQRIRDIEAVMDAAGWTSANIIGVSEGGLMAQHFATKHPDRVEKLVLNCTLAPMTHGDRVRQLSGDSYRSVTELLDDFGAIAENWGENAERFVQLMSPSQADNPSYIRWANRLNRLSASPTDFMRQLESVMFLHDGLDPTMIDVPTMIVQTTNDRLCFRGNGAVLSELIADSVLVEVEGADHFLVTMDNWRDVFDPTIEFLTGTRPPTAVQRQFATVMFTDIVGSTTLASSLGDDTWREMIDRHDRITHRVTASSSGRVVKSTGDGLLAVFDTPSSALDAATRMRSDLAEIGLPIRVGLHAGEIEVHADRDISGLAVNLAARVEQAATDGAIFVSSTMKDMLLGSQVLFEDRGEHQLKGIEGSWQLFELADS